MLVRMFDSSENSDKSLNLVNAKEYPSVNSEIANDNMNIDIYLAGPCVFKPNPKEVGEQKKQILLGVDKRLHGQFPMDPYIPDFAFDKRTALNIFAGNKALMNKSQIILVNMTPWHRSPSMDVGTAFEAGYMSRKAEEDPKNVLIIGYYEGPVKQNLAERVIDVVYDGQITYVANAPLTDKEGVSIENFGITENLMIVAAIEETGGDIFSSFKEAVQNIKPLLAAKFNNMTQEEIQRSLLARKYVNMHLEAAEREALEAAPRSGNGLG